MITYLQDDLPTFRDASHLKMPIVEGLETSELRDLLVSMLLTKANNNQVLMPHTDEDEHKMLRKNPGNV